MSKVKIALIALALVVAAKVTAQKITMYKTFGGVVYMFNDTTEISTKQTASILFSHEKAYGEFKKARTWSGISAVTGFSGAALIAIPLATIAFGERADWGYAVAGGSLLAVGMISNWVYKGRAIGAIELYNEDLPHKSSRIKPQLQFYGTGAKLVIRF
jgi:hypothetical protein